MIEYAVEDFRDLRDELPPLFRRHWERIAGHKKEIALNPDWDSYIKLAEKGILHCVTVREYRKLIGYYFFLAETHLHYKQSLTAFTDIYYIQPGINPFALFARYRRLIQTAEGEMRRLHVQKVYTAVKLHSDLGRLWERLGYSPTERTYTKLLE